MSGCDDEDSADDGERGLLRVTWMLEGSVDLNAGVPNMVNVKWRSFNQ